MNFLKTYGNALITLLVFCASMYFGFKGEPGEIITGDTGWVIVRGVTLLWTIAFGVGSIAGWFNLGAGVKELVSQVKGAKNSTNTAILKWVIICAVIGQVVASFYIAENCPNGF